VIYQEAATMRWPEREGATMIWPTGLALILSTLSALTRADPVLTGKYQRASSVQCFFCHLIRSKIEKIHDVIFYFILVNN
jgi:hypothetical protein